MKKANVLLADSAVNFLIGILLLFFPRGIIEFLGVPFLDNAFYPSILGAILIGIGIALFFEWSRKKSRVIGLGMGGAIIINTCVGLALMAWLLLGDLDMPLRGYIVLWCIVLIALGLTLLELMRVKNP